MASQRPLQRIHSSVQVLAGAWAQALADISRVVELIEAKDALEYHRCLALYNKASSQHQVGVKQIRATWEERPAPHNSLSR